MRRVLLRSHRTHWCIIVLLCVCMCVCVCVCVCVYQQDRGKGTRRYQIGRRVVERESVDETCSLAISSHTLVYYCATVCVYVCVCVCVCVCVSTGQRKGETQVSDRKTRRGERECR